MSNTETKFSRRMIAFWLSLIIIVGMVPIELLSVFAQPGAERTSVFTLTVTDQDGDAIENAAITGNYGVLPVTGSTDGFGVLEVQDITEAITQNQVGTELILSVTADGYQDIINQSFGSLGETSDDAFKDVPITMTGNPANITINPLGEGLLVDETLSLSVVATNVKAYQWYKNGSEISGATNGVYSKTAALDDAGTYKCVVTGTDGKDAYSADAIITVDRRATNVGISAAPNQQSRPNAVVLRATGLPADATGTLTFFEGNNQIGSSVAVGQTVNFNAVGAVNNYTFKVKYSGSETKYYGSESSGLPLSFTKGTQTTPLVINNVPATIKYGDTFTVTATGGNGTGSITWKIIDEFDSDDNPTTQVASISSNGVVTFLKTGSFKISALRGADNDYDAMDTEVISSVVTVTKGTPVGFVFANPSPEAQIYSPNFTFSNIASGGNVNGAITYKITGGTGSAQIDTDTGLISNVTKAGTIIVKATKASDSGYWSSATASYTLTVNKADQTGFGFSEATPEAQVYSPSFSFVNVASGGQSVNEPTYAITGGTGQASVDGVSGEMTTVTKVGTITVTATKLGNDVYNDVTVDYTITINKADQTTFAFTSTVPTDFRYGMQFTNSASGGESSGAISYQVTVRNDVAAVDENGTVTMVKNPPNADTDAQITITVTATKAGDLVYNEKVITYDLIIHRDSVTVADFRVNGEAIKSTTEWYNAADVEAYESKITFTPSNGYTQISTDGLIWSSYLEFATGEVISTSFYLKKDNGATSNISDTQTVKFDKTAPENATITVDTFSPWANFWNTITFRLFSKDSKQVSITATDDVSSVATIAYHEDNTGTDFSPEQAAALSYTAYDDGSKPSVSFSDLQNKKVVIYAKVTDVAGNISYFRTNGMVFDNMNPEGDTTLSTPIIQITLPDSKNVGLYKDDIPFRVQVTDPDTNSLAAGIESVTTTISAPNRDDKTITATAVSTELEPLDSSFDSDNIIDAFNNAGTYVVEKEYESNYIAITVVAVDKAGNEYTRTVSLALDITVPEIEVSYDNNTFSNGIYIGNNLNRKATIEITELNFDNNAVVINVTRDGEKVNIVPAFTAIFGEVDENGDQIGWRMVIDYAQFGDGDYTFDISYTDKAGNANHTVDYGGSINPQVFTIDNTTPTISVSYDNNSALNSNYYRMERTAIITITEHNFEAGMVNIIGTAVDDGTTITFPAVNGWISNGDLRTATINYSSDAYYTFNIEYMDLAGNIAASYTPENFYIDKTIPILKNEQDNKTADVYVAEEQAKILEYYDKNFHEIKHTFSAYNFNIKDKNQKLYELIAIDNDPSVITGSAVNLSESFFSQDGVYEIKSTAFDLAGNDSGEKVYTYVVMRNTTMMAYIPEDNLMKFNNIGTRAIEFEDIPINVYVANDSAFTLKIGDEMLLESSDYTVLGVSEIANQVKEHRLVVPQSYIANTFNEDNQVYDLPINVMNTDGQIITIGRMVIDNVRPFGEFEEEFKNGKGYYGVSEETVQIVKLSDDIDKKATTVNVDGNNVDFIYDPDTKTISFTLSKSSAYGLPLAGHSIKVQLVDTAGNEYSLEEVTNIYVGNRFLRFWIIFVGGGILLAGVGVFFWLKIRKKKEY